MDFLQEARWLPSLYNRHPHERVTSVAMETIYQLSTYINVYVDIYQNNLCERNNDIVPVAN